MYTMELLNGKRSFLRIQVSHKSDFCMGKSSILSRAWGVTQIKALPLQCVTYVKIVIRYILRYNFQSIMRYTLLLLWKLQPWYYLFLALKSIQQWYFCLLPMTYHNFVSVSRNWLYVGPWLATPAIFCWFPHQICFFLVSGSNV